ncbi:MAG: acyltransferase [Fulvivirga sp.]
MYRFWNNNVGGLPKVFAILLNVLYKSLYEKISSFFWKFNLCECGLNVIIQKGTVIRMPSRIQLNDNVSIGRDCQISSEFQDSYLMIGKNTKIDKNCLLDYSGGLRIGHNVTLSEGVMIETHSHGYNPRSIPAKRPLEIMDNVWIGAHTIILPNVKIIGKNVIIGAGSVVTKSIEESCIVAGNPAKVLKTNNKDFINE